MGTGQATSRAPSKASVAGFMDPDAQSGPGAQPTSQHRGSSGVDESCQVPVLTTARPHGKREVAQCRCWLTGWLGAEPWP